MTSDHRERSIYNGAAAPICWRSYRPMWTLRILAGLLLAMNLGCQYSRWALKDPDYAAKYDQRPELLDIPLQAKQASDARHLAGKGGTFYGGAGQSDPFAGGLEVGGFSYPTSWLEGRASLALLASSAGENLFYGLNLGIRAQSPTRLAPFVGVGIGGFQGVIDDSELADNDGIDNDDDGFIDEQGEEETSADFFRGRVSRNWRPLLAFQPCPYYCERCLSCDHRRPRPRLLVLRHLFGLAQ